MSAFELAACLARIVHFAHALDLCPTVTVRRGHADTWCVQLGDDGPSVEHWSVNDAACQLEHELLSELGKRAAELIAEARRLEAAANAGDS